MQSRDTCDENIYSRAAVPPFPHHQTPFATKKHYIAAYSHYLFIIILMQHLDLCCPYLFFNFEGREYRSLC